MGGHQPPQSDTTAPAGAVPSALPPSTHADMDIDPTPPPSAHPSAPPAAAPTGRQTSAQNPPSPSLNFLSPGFDPLRALHTPGLQPPLPSVLPLDNVSQCRKLLPPELQPGDREARPANEESRKKHLRFKESAIRGRERILSSVALSLDGVMAAAASPGPLDSLRRWHAAGTRVSVTTRHASGVRGCATGVLTAYDRFLNLVLRDVTERYTVPVRHVKEYTRMVPVTAGGATDAGGSGAAATTATAAAGSDFGGVAGPSGARSALSGPSAGGGLGGGAEGAGAEVEHAGPGAEAAMREVTRMRVVRRREVRQRQLGQVFIKGDNVVAVYAAAEGAGKGEEGEGLEWLESSVMARMGLQPRGGAPSSARQSVPPAMFRRGLPPGPGPGAAGSTGPPSAGAGSGSGHSLLGSHPAGLPPAIGATHSGAWPTSGLGMDHVRGGTAGPHLAGVGSGLSQAGVPGLPGGRSGVPPGSFGSGPLPPAMQHRRQEPLLGRPQTRAGPGTAGNTGGTGGLPVRQEGALPAGWAGPEQELR